MNWRQPTYLAYAALRGYRFPRLFRKYQQLYDANAHSATSLQCLSDLLRHCRRSVPFYSPWLEKYHDDELISQDPREILRGFPILTKDIIRTNFTRLHSSDIGARTWFYNTSGGSTGEPVKFIQDRDYDDCSNASSMLCHSLMGCEPGRPIVRLWGSERDLERSVKSRKARFFNWLTNTTWLNAFQMTPQRMHEFVDTLNEKRPHLILAYAQAAYELARFIEREQLVLVPQPAIVTSAGTLYPFMREKIAQVFGGKVYNLYGSREVSLIACEIPGNKGLWVVPWSNYVEILDDDGKPVPDGVEGNVVVTCLTNYAMPLVRYQIGDRGALAPNTPSQTLQSLSGRNVDAFRTRDGKIVDGEYFTHLLYFRSWVSKFQVVQKDYEQVLFKIVKLNGAPCRQELDEIESKSRLVLGPRCRVDFEFPEALPPHPAGKFRYTISEVRM